MAPKQRQKTLAFASPAEWSAFAAQVADSLDTGAYTGSRQEQVAACIADRGYNPTDEAISDVMTAIANRGAGWDILMPLINDPTITDIAVNAPDNIWVQRSAGWENSDLAFASRDALANAISRIVGLTGANAATVEHPVVDGSIPNGPRICAVIEPASDRSPILSVRKFRPLRFSLIDLYNRVSPPTLDWDMAVFLDTAVRARLNIIVSGGTGSGKTTFLGALLGRIPRNERYVIIEDTPELRFMTIDDSKRNFVPLIAKDGNHEFDAEADLRTSMRLAPDRIILGESRGGEALTMLQAMNTGHEGSMSGVHANSAEDTPNRLASLAMQHNTQLPLTAIRSQIGSSVDIIVHLVRRKDHRFVSEIAEIDGRDTEHPITRSLWKYDPSNARWLLGEAPMRWSRLAPYWPDHPVPWKGLSREGDDTQPQDMILTPV